MDGLVPGRMVYFVFDAASAAEANRRRTSSAAIRGQIQAGAWPIGAQAHIGSTVTEGDILPAMVTRVEAERVNVKVMLDGTDVYWKQFVPFDEAKRPGTWHWMYAGQSTRGSQR